jgi:hypothetical protein
MAIYFRFFAKLLVSLLLILSTTTALAQSKQPSPEILHNLSQYNTQKAVIITSQEIPSSAIKHVFIKPGTSHVHIQSKSYDFTEESREFDAFKNRYPIYWAVFTGILILKAL